jgi:hypothetical protein
MVAAMSVARTLEVVTVVTAVLAAKVAEPDLKRLLPLFGSMQQHHPALDLTTPL